MKRIASWLQKLDVLKLVVLLIVIAAFLPRVVQKGLFGDGLLYASMARNMAEGRGSFWKPFFSSSYWLENIPSTYFENPPLMLWLESLAFLVFGDHWWVEKVFCIFVFILNGLLLKWLWQTIFDRTHTYHTFWYVVILCWYFIPVTPWANVNNMMDTLLTSFCLLAVLCYFKMKNSETLHYYKWMVMMSCSIFLAILVKGPVALYPLALPVMYTWIVDRRTTLFKPIYSTILISTVTALMFLMLWYSIEDARHFFTQYWEQRLKAVIVGSRDDMKLTGWNKLYIVQALAIELSVLVSLSMLMYIYLKYKKKWRPELFLFRMAAMFFAVGLCATLPILISTKQSNIYLIAGLPMFALSAAILWTPLVIKLHEKLRGHVWLRWVNGFVVFGFVVVGWMTYIQYGVKGREVALMEDIEIIKTVVPTGSKILVSKNLMYDFNTQTYMQRMGKYELSFDINQASAAIGGDAFLTPVDSSRMIKADVKLKYYPTLYIQPNIHH